MPVEISHGGVVIRKQDMVTSQEEAANFFVQQMVMVEKGRPKGIPMLAEGTSTSLC